MTSTHGHNSVGRPAKTCIHYFCTDRESCLEDLPSVMADRNGCQERVKGICVIGMS